MSSDPFQTAILDALKTERKPKHRRYLFAFLIGTISFLLIYFGFKHWVFEIHLKHWIWIAGLWSFLLGLGSFFFLTPQPRWEVPGYFSKFVLAKICLASGAAMVAQLLLCPHFAFIPSQLSSSSNIFYKLTNFYMSLGGMRACLFLCGLSFGFLASFFSHLFIFKSLSLKHPKTWAISSLLIVFLMSPLSLWTTDQHEGEVLFWILGIIIGVFIPALMFCFAKAMKK